TSLVERERNILAEQARASGKGEEVIAKMVEGRLRKFYEENVLTEQVFVVDGETRIKDLLVKSAKEIGSEITLPGFARYGLGEGIEKEATDFAAEVAAQARLK
ncbi:MAG: elongation factor Ts, partial [Alphaproteobacteria bacterium]|nr:elongation factor Ts [Alphaproteobacteria bacterium]